MHASVLGKWYPGEVQGPGRKRHPAVRQQSYRDLLALLVSEAHADTHRFSIFIKQRGARRKLVTIAQTKVTRCKWATLLERSSANVSQDAPGYV
jgi:hypothetical protein